MNNSEATLMAEGVSPSPSAIVAGFSCPITSIPFAVFLRETIFHVVFCGGSLITADWVLTASHCVYQFRTYAGYVEVVAGATNINNILNAQKTKAKAIFPHPEFKESFPELNDVALVRLMGKIKIGRGVEVAELPKRVYEDVDELVRECWDGLVAGWGSQVGDDVVLRVQNLGRQQPMVRDGLLKCMKVVGVTKRR